MRGYVITGLGATRLLLNHHDYPPQSAGARHAVFGPALQGAAAGLKAGVYRASVVVRRGGRVTIKAGAKVDPYVEQLRLTAHTAYAIGQYAPQPRGAIARRAWSPRQEAGRVSHNLAQLLREAFPKDSEEP